MAASDNGGAEATGALTTGEVRWALLAPNRPAGRTVGSARPLWVPGRPARAALCFTAFYPSVL